MRVNKINILISLRSCYFPKGKKVRLFAWGLVVRSNTLQSKFSVLNEQALPQTGLSALNM